MAESSAGRKLWALGAATLLLVVTSPARAQRGAELYGKWWTICDNTRTCAVYGTGGSEGVAVTIMVHRGPEAQALPRVSVVTDGPRAPKTGATWRVFVDGHAIASGRARLGQVMEADLNGPDGQALLARMLNGRELRVDGPGAGASLGLSGAGAAFRDMDEAQGRNGGVTALVARGTRPATAVPRAPSAPVIEIGALPTQLDLPGESPLGMLDRRRCRVGKGKLDGARVYRLGDDALLWLTPCGRSDRGQSLVLLSNAKGGKVRAALGGKGKGEQVEARFDPRTAVLTAYESEHGLTDCGKGVDYVWTGEAFQIVREREMSQCVGLPRDLWPDTFRAVVRRAW